jgi:type IV pilus assembly protein PilO
MAGQLDTQKLLEQLEHLPAPARYGVLAGVGVAVLVIYYFTLFSSVKSDLDLAQRQLIELQGKIAETQAVVSNLETFRARREELAKRYESARERLPSATELPVLLTDISSLGKKAGLEFRAFKPEEEVQKNFYAEVPIHVEFLGAYHQIGVFFDRLSKLSRIVNLTEFDMVLKAEGGEAPQLEVKGTATTYRFTEKPTAKGGV